MTLQAYVDESEDPRWFVLAGYIASTEQWDAFSKEWRELLPLSKVGPKGGRRFKMSEMATPHFLSNVPAFYKSIEDNTRTGVAVSIDKDKLSAALKRVVIISDDYEIMPKAGAITPYYIAFSFLVRMFHERRADMGMSQHLSATETVDFIFDERSEGREIIGEWRAFLDASPCKEMYGADPVFRDDNKFLPLQAADFLAWWVRRWLQTGDETKSLGWATKRLSFYSHIEPTEQEMFEMLNASAMNSVRNVGLSAKVYDAKTFVSTIFHEDTSPGNWHA